MEKEFCDCVEIKNLERFPDHVKTVSIWIWKYFNKKNGMTLKQVNYRTIHCLSRNKIPMTFVAFHNENPIGTVSLWQNDLKSRQDLTPWLSALYVDKKYRKKGVGKKLIEVAIKEARKIGHDSLYLITDHRGYYEKLGWSFLEKAPLDNGKLTRIYEFKITNQLHK